MNKIKSEPFNYTASINIHTDIVSAFEALSEKIDKWWSTVDNSANEEGNIFKVSFGVDSYWTFKVLAFKKYDKIMWQCIESHQDHHLKGMDEEWLNSKLYWNFEVAENGVKLQFLHEGLVSTGVCFDVCSSAWDFYILESLKDFLETGVGKVEAY